MKERSKYNYSKNKHCLDCGRLITNNANVCVECRYISKNRNYKSINCVDCGNLIKKKSGRQERCKECSKIRIKELNKSYEKNSHSWNNHCLDCGRLISNYADRCKSCRMKGEKHPLFGKHHKRETIEKMRKPKSEEYRKKKSELMKGKPVLHLKKYLFKKGQTPWSKGKKFSEKTRKKLSETRKRLFKEGKIKSWNEGLTIETDERLKKSILKGTKTRKKLIKEGKLDFLNNILDNLQIKPNQLEKVLIKIIKKHKLPFKYTGDGSFWIEKINPDFVESNGKKIAIEIFGEYWHSPLLNHKVTWNRTLPGRKTILKKYGWKLIVLWGNEIYKGEDYILKKIKDVL